MIEITENGITIEVKPVEITIEIGSGSGGGGEAAWGSISGTLSNQTDLQNALDAKANGADLGAMAYEADAPADNVEYVRKNRAWAVSSGGGGGGSAVWGGIHGTLSMQTDLQTALDGKAAASHDHDDRYYTETETDALLADKAAASHTHDDRYYTETETDTLLADKAAASHTHDDRYYTVTETDTLLAEKATASHTHDDRYYTVTETNTLLTEKAAASHTHDDRYYTETETDALLADKADTADLGGIEVRPNYDIVDDTQEPVDGTTVLTTGKLVFVYEA